ncbi:MAG: GNAT family N-acetyltransferase [Longibaculum sp.]
MEVKILRGHDVSRANQLIHKVFNHQLAKHYSDEGKKEFLQTFENENILSLMKQQHLLMLGAFFENELIGVIGIFDFKHIQSLFVDEKYQGQGIGTQLLNHAKKLMLGDICVNADEDAILFYKKNGFEIVNEKQTVHGITFQPMIYHSENLQRFTTYDQVHDFIASQKDRVYALDNFRRFMQDMANPQTLLKTIHIGGTNGKGSTTNYLRSVLQKAGYSVATFTSPVLVTRLEVMRINNQHILEDEIIAYANRYMNLWLEYELSMFEIEVFIAIMFFLKHRVDFAIFEVGLGGELDATNIVSPIIASNTNIGLDHTEYLGDTYEKIARTKGGIIKDYVPFITGEKKKECIQVFQEICLTHHSPLLFVQPITNIQDNQQQVSFDYRQYHVVLQTSARYQCENSALALEILLYLRENGYAQFDDATMLQGLKDAMWAGRFEKVCDHPLMIIDGAHNKEGMEAFYQSAKKYSHIKVIFSALRDKDTHAMMELLLKLTDDVTVCEFDFYRAQSAEKLAESFPVKIEKDWHKAVDEAFGYDGVVFITGSLYFISQVRPYIQKQLSLKK